ncbi:hypothetical protein [Lachnospira multipara]|uniref:Uncharacterized protein n=1 Tax=Lachnospira multipara TaxID=28051 RepID=A0A1H5VPG5_9FIRM|nr:hypothetical protein [Lachnospira multipara]SEF89134.1 hypothetical protein SAMN05216537_11214 [Lachnospira multipara]
MDNELNKEKLAASIINVFEDFLNNLGIDIPNDEKCDAIMDGKESKESIPNIYGKDYFDLENSIMNVLTYYGVFPEQNVLENRTVNMDKIKEHNRRRKETNSLNNEVVINNLYITKYPSFAFRDIEEKLKEAGINYRDITEEERNALSQDFVSSVSYWGHEWGSNRVALIVTEEPIQQLIKDMR